MDATNVLVTGANGFIGRELILQLLKKRPAPTIYAIGRKSPEIPGARNYGFDLTDDTTLGTLIEESQPDSIYHLAGSSRVTDSITMPEYFSKNFLTTVALIQGMKKIKSPFSVFFSSSVHVYGNQVGEVSEKSSIHPVSPYGFTKYLAEEALREFSTTSPLTKIVVGRLSSCVGPGQPRGFAASDLCRKIADLKGTPSETLQVGPLSGYRRFLDIRDGAEFLPALLKAPWPSKFETVNLASPHELRIQTVLEILLRIAGKSPVVKSSESVASNKLTGLKLDLGKMEKALPSVHYRPIEETLREMYEWAVAHPEK